MKKRNTLSKWKQTKVDNTEHEKAKTFIVVEIIEYVPNSVVIKTIIKRGYEDISL